MHHRVRFRIEQLEKTPDVETRLLRILGRVHTIAVQEAEREVGRRPHFSAMEIDSPHLSTPITLGKTAMDGMHMVHLVRYFMKVNQSRNLLDMHRTPLDIRVVTYDDPQGAQKLSRRRHRGPNRHYGAGLYMDEDSDNVIFFTRQKKITFFRILVLLKAKMKKKKHRQHLDKKLGIQRRTKGCTTECIMV